jgi:hypothetical protein
MWMFLPQVEGALQIIWIQRTVIIDEDEQVATGCCNTANAGGRQPKHIFANVRVIGVPRKVPGFGQALLIGVVNEQQFPSVSAQRLSLQGF